MKFLIRERESNVFFKLHQLLLQPGRGLGMNADADSMWNLCRFFAVGSFWNLRRDFNL